MERILLIDDDAIFSGMLSVLLRAAATKCAASRTGTPP